MVIADLFFRALLESRQLQQQAEQAGDQAGQTMGQRMSQGISMKMRAGLAFMSAATALATKGMIELDEATQQFVADTGASADEADRAKKAINEMAGRNLQPMREIGNALGKVHTDMGLVGDEAEEVTEKFLKFANVTKRDAAAEVEAFDDILDAYGITAERIPGIMDQLVKSHQEFGGAIAEDEAALKRMAPALKAFNLGIDEGIGLLNLFKESGIDASRAPRALNMALKNLNGETFPDFIKRLSQIENQSERAIEAGKIFGSQFGPAMANAIRPGREGLEDFIITVEEAEGATTDASRALEDTFGNRLKLLINGIGTALRDIFGPAGPLLTGLAALSTLAGSTGLGGVLKDVVSTLATAGKDAGKAFVNEMATAIGAAGTIIGNLTASFMDPSSGLGGNRFALALKRGAAAAAGLWGTIFGATVELAEKMTQLFLGLPFIPKLRGAVLAAGIATGGTYGTTMGSAAGKAFVIAFVLGFAKLAEEIEPHTSKLGRDIHDAIFQGPLEGIGDFGEQLGRSIQGLDESMPWPFGRRDGPWTKNLPKDVKDALGIIETEAKRVVGGMRAVEIPVTLGTPERPALGPPLPPPEWFTNQQQQALVDRAMGLGRALTEALTSTLRRALAGDGTAIVAIGHDMRLAGAQVSLDLANGLRSARGNITSALSQLSDDLANALSPKKEVAQRMGQLFSRTLVRGLKSIDPLVRAQAEGTRALIEDQLIQTVLAGGKAGKDILEELERKMNSKKPAVKRQAERTKSVIDAALKAKAAGVKSPGDAIGDQLNADLKSKATALGGTAYNLGRTIFRNLMAGVKGTGPVAPSGGGGGPTAPVYRKNQPEYQHGTNYVPADQYAFLHQGEMVIPAREAAMVRSGEPQAPSATPSVTLVMPDARNRDPFEVLERARRYQQFGLFSAARPSAGG